MLGADEGKQNLEDRYKAEMDALSFLVKIANGWDKKSEEEEVLSSRGRSTKYAAADKGKQKEKEKVRYLLLLVVEVFPSPADKGKQELEEGEGEGADNNKQGAVGIQEIHADPPEADPPEVDLPKRVPLMHEANPPEADPPENVHLMPEADPPEADPPEPVPLMVAANPTEADPPQRADPPEPDPLETVEANPPQRVFMIIPGICPRWLQILLAMYAAGAIGYLVYIFLTRLVFHSQLN